MTREELATLDVGDMIYTPASGEGANAAPESERYVVVQRTLDGSVIAVSTAHVAPYNCDCWTKTEKD